MNSTTLLKSVELFQLYYTPLLVYLGVIGNSLCVYVFRSSKLRVLSSSYYLSALAISDTVFLLALFTVWMTMVGIDVFNQPGACQIIVFVTGVCSFLSVWFVVAFTVERFIAVRYPLLRHSLCTVQRAKIVLMSLTLFSLVLYSPLLLFAGAIRLPETPMLCTVVPLWQDEAAVFNIVDTIATFVIPVLIIVKLNICISQAVWNLHNIRNRLIQKKPKRAAADGQVAGPVRQKFERRNNSQKKVTKMLLVVSTIFLCLNLPSYIMRVLTYLIEAGIKCGALEGLETILDEILVKVNENIYIYQKAVQGETDTLNHAEYDEKFKALLNEVLDNIANQIKQILDDTGMEGHPELVAHCSLTYITALEDLKSSADGAYSICSELLDKYKLDITKEQNAMLEKLKNDINLVIVDYLMQACESEDDEKTKECLVEKVIKAYETVKGRKEEIENSVNEITKQVNQTKDLMERCYDTTVNALTKDTTSIVQNFEKCVTSIKHLLGFM